MLGMIRIAFRNTRRQLKRTILLGGAIAFGVMVITLLNAFTAGLAESMKENVAYAFGGHIFIGGVERSDTGRHIGRIANGTDLELIIEESGLPVQSVHRRTETIGTLIFGSRQATEQIQGVDFTAETNLGRGLPLRAGSLEALTEREDAFVLTGLAAQKLGVEVGETVLVRLQTVTGQQNVGEFTVVAIIEDSTSLGMVSSIASLPYLNDLIGLEADQYQMLNVVLSDMLDINRAADMIYEVAGDQGLNIERPLVETTVTLNTGALIMGGEQAREEPWEGTKYQIMTINEIMAPIEAVLAVFDAVGLGIFLILLLITMVGIMNTFRMVLIERTQEIGTMRAFGMQRGTVRSIFLWEAGFIAMGGGIAGIVLAGGIIAILSRISVAHIPGMQILTMNGYFNFDITVGALITNLVIVLIMSLLAALLPSNAAAKMPPVKALSANT